MKIIQTIKIYLIVSAVLSLGIAQDFSATVTFTGEGQSRGLTVGFSPNATDGYDAGYCSNSGISDYDGCSILVQTGYLMPMRRRHHRLPHLMLH